MGLRVEEEFALTEQIIEIGENRELIEVKQSKR